MILVDGRVGSGELVGMFPAGMATLGRLEYGDMAFIGNGKGGVPCMVGVERKKVRDLVNCMVSGRFSGHQLPGLLNAYNVVYLVVEGVWRPGVDGVVEVLGRGGWVALVLGRMPVMYDAVVNFLNTITVMTGVRVVSTGGDRETVRVVTALYHWWEKGWDEHTSHLREKQVEAVYLVKPSFKQTVAAALPGVGTARSRAVCERFRSVRDMAVAEKGEWLDVDGVGSKTAEKIVRAFTH